jgi:hypothetical protein
MIWKKQHFDNFQNKYKTDGQCKMVKIPSILNIEKREKKRKYNNAYYWTI